MENAAQSRPDGLAAGKGEPFRTLFYVKKYFRQAGGGYGSTLCQAGTREVTDTINEAVEFVLIHHIYKRSHNLNRVSKPGWLKFGFPLMYQTDALEILDILTELGIEDSRMDEAVRLVLEKQDDTGRWRIENTYSSDRLLIPMGQKGEPSKWITLRAMRVLKRYQHSPG